MIRKRSNSIVERKQCPQCASEGRDNSEDNLVVYEDGGTYCFSGHGGNQKSLSAPPETFDDVDFKELKGTYVDLKTRKISAEMCKKWGVLYLPNYLGEPTLAFQYLKNGKLNGYALKSLSKRCKLKGDVGRSDMFGSHLHGDPTNKTLVITEGHEDCISCNIACGDASFHYTSLPHGTDTVKNFINHHYDKLCRYAFITLCFDNDNAGREATDKFIELFNQIGKVKQVKLPLKDANEMLTKGKLDLLKWAIIKAEVHKPKQIADWTELTPVILTKPVVGRPWPWRPLDEVTHGFYEGKLYAIGSATSVGKTTFIKDIVFDFIEKSPQFNVGCFFLEQKPVEVAHKLLSSMVGHDLEQPDTPWWDEDILKTHIDKLKKHVFLYDPTKGIELSEIVSAIYYFVNVENVKVIIIDNLTILSENRMIDGKRVTEMEYMTEVGKLFNKVKRELNISIFLICHLSQDKIGKTAYVTTSPKNVDSYMSATSKDMDGMVNRPGLTWETGRMPSIESLYGGATLAKLADYVIVLARNTTSDDDLEFRTTRVKIIKTRLRKHRAKIEFELVYDPEMGRLVSVFNGD